MNELVKDSVIFMFDDKNKDVNYLENGIPAIKVHNGDEFLFDDETLQNMIRSLSPDILLQFDMSIRRATDYIWCVKFGTISSNWIFINSGESN